jgi:hypothetical protein
MFFGKKAGALIVRSQPGMTGTIFRKVREWAKLLELPVTFELHAPMNLETPRVKELMEVIAEPESKGLLGVTPDFSLFQFQPPAPQRKNLVKAGFDPKKLEQLLMLLKQGASHTEMLNSIPYTEIEKPMVDQIVHMYGNTAKISDLDYLVPYTFYIHGKFHYINDNLIEDSIPYDVIMPKIKKLGYNGYIACEYEGHGMDLSIDPIEQLNKFRKMVSPMV